MSKYLPVGIDPDEHTCSVAIVYPNHDLLLRGFTIKNNSFSNTQFLIAQAGELTQKFGLDPIFVFEAANVFCRPLFSYLTRNGFLCHTVCAKQTNRASPVSVWNGARATGVRKTKTDKIDATLTLLRRCLKNQVEGG